MSYRAIADASGISTSRIGQMATGQHLAQMPPDATIEALARALGLPAQDVYDAAETTVRMGAKRTVRRGSLPRRIADLPPRDVAIVEALVTALEDE